MEEASRGRSAADPVSEPVGDRPAPLQAQGKADSSSAVDWIARFNNQSRTSLPLALFADQARIRWSLFNKQEMSLGEFEKSWRLRARATSPPELSLFEERADRVLVRWAWVEAKAGGILEMRFDDSGRCTAVMER